MKSEEVKALVRGQVQKAAGELVIERFHRPVVDRIAEQVGDSVMGSAWDRIWDLVEDRTYVVYPIVKHRSAGRHEVG